MYHGIPLNTEFFALVFGAIVWIIRGVARGLKQLRKTGPAVPPSQAPTPPSVVPGQQAGPPPSAPMRVQNPPQKLSVRPAVQARPRERQPAAGGPAVPEEATRRDFERQEQGLFASEPTALNTPLTSAPDRSAAPANTLFGGSDDLIRAIILQEVLGPPLSRRAAKSSQSPAQLAPAPASLP